MSWLSVFLKKDNVKLILKWGEAILKLFLGKAAQELQNYAFSAVKSAEATGKSGLDKYEYAFKEIRKVFPDIKERLINHAIESAVLALDALKTS